MLHLTLNACFAVTARIRIYISADYPHVNFNSSSSCPLNIFFIFAQEEESGHNMQSFDGSLQAHVVNNKEPYQPGAI